MAPVEDYVSRTDYKKQRNRCPNCGHREGMHLREGGCTVEQKEAGNCKCGYHGTKKV